MMKKNILFTSLYLALTICAFAQVHLDVEGDAKIYGKLEMHNSDSSLIIGTNAGLTHSSYLNTFIGINAGMHHFLGQYNTYVGFSAAGNSPVTAGSHNTFNGYKAGYKNFGNFNTFIGSGAGFNNTSGESNTFIGGSTGPNNTTGTSNTFIGRQAGQQNTSGNENTFIGSNAGLYNKASANTFVGFEAGKSSTSSSSLAFGNTFIGKQAGLNNVSGTNNTVVGRNAGSNITTQHDLIAFGAFADGVSQDMENAFAIGNNSLMLKSHSGVLGNLAIQTIGGYVNWGTASDSRMKKNVREDVKGLDFVLQLRPVSYQVDAVKLNQFLRTGMEENARNNSAKKEEVQRKAEEKLQAAYQNALKEKSKIRYTGFVAQEVEKAAQKVGFTFSGIIHPAHEKDHYSLRYAEFVVPLVKGMQEQQTMIAKQEKTIGQQQKAINQLQREVVELKKIMEQVLSKNNTTENTLLLSPKAKLSQNQPNPFHQNTVVNYFVPERIQQAQIQVTTIDGKVLGTFPIRQTGTGQVILKANSYAAGTYYYSLLLDGQVVETKKMVLTR